MIRYIVPLRCPCKVNGLQNHSGQRDEFDLRRVKLQDHLRKNYDRPTTISLPVMLYVAVHLRDMRAGDVFAYMDGLADSISVGKKVQGNRRVATLRHLFPVLDDDSLILAPTFFPEYGQVLMPGAGEDKVEFSVVLL